MKSNKIFLATALSFALSFSAQAKDNSWYVGASLNTTDLSDIESQSTSPVGGTFRNLDITTDSEVNFGLKIGRTVFSSSSGSLDIELNYSQSDHDVDTIIFQGNSFENNAAEGSIEAESLTLRAAYKFNTGSAIKPYVGVGVGLVDLSFDARYGGSIGSASATNPPFATGSDDALGLELRLGADWKLNNNLSLFAEYSFTDVSDINFTRLGGGPGGLAETSQESDFDLEAFTVGINYHF